MSELFVRFAMYGFIALALYVHFVGIGPDLSEPVELAAYATGSAFAFFQIAFRTIRFVWKKLAEKFAPPKDLRPWKH